MTALAVLLIVAQLVHARMILLVVLVQMLEAMSAQKMKFVLEHH